MIQTSRPIDNCHPESRLQTLNPAVESSAIGALSFLSPDTGNARWNTRKTLNDRAPASTRGQGGIKFTARWPRHGLWFDIGRAGI
jgi:hypothetical protein